MQRYLGLLQQQRMDYLIHLLVDKVLPDYHQQEKAAELGIIKTRLSKAELATWKKAYIIPAEEAANMIEESLNGCSLQSFNLPDKCYQVQLREIDSVQCIEDCSCPSYMLSCISCKHMWIVVHTLGFSFAYIALQKEEHKQQGLPAPSTMIKIDPLSEEMAEILEIKQDSCQIMIHNAEALVKLCQQLSNLGCVEWDRIS